MRDSELGLASMHSMESNLKKKVIERIFSQQTQKGYWITNRITDPRSSNVDRTAFVLARDLSTIPKLSNDPRTIRAIAHLLSSQNPDGGWSDLEGEPSRPAVTSYVLWGLGKFDVRSSKEVERGVRWLEKTQSDDGGWAEIVERPWEGGIRPGETQPWITISCVRGLYGCPQTSKKSIQKAMDFLEKTQRNDGSWEGRMGTDMVLGTFNIIGLTIETEMVRRGVDYQLSFLRSDGYLPDAWEGKTLMHMIRCLHCFIGLGVPLEDERISKIIAYLKANKKVLIDQLDTHATLEILKIMEDMN